MLAVAVSVAEGAEKVAEVGCGRALVVVVITESVAQVAVEEESTPGAATEKTAEESITEVTAEELIIEATLARFNEGFPEVGLVARL